MMYLCLRILLFFSIFPLWGVEKSTALYYSLDPSSFTQAAAFYELYPETPEADKIISRLKNLLQSPLLSIENLIGVFHRFPPGTNQVLTEEQVATIDTLAAHLPNRALKGYQVSSKEEMRLLAPEEIDLSVALLLEQILDPQARKSYLAFIDLMALQILARVPLNGPVEKKIAETNRFIFEEMRFRFPPHSIYAKNIDLFTFLPSVMDNHIGVCLGVTTLYLTIAQRIGLPLEIITPPGHIFVRYREGERVINIETTARGIHLPTEHYENLQTKKKLAPRTLKETIGMTFVNDASIRWEDGDFAKGAAAYEKALLYMQDPFIQELLAYCYLLLDQKERGEALLRSLKELSEGGQDYLAGKVSKEGIRALFLRVDERRCSILKKLEQLQGIVGQFPQFRSGWEQVATCFLQLHRPKEAIEALLRYHTLDSENPLIEFYLAVLHAEREDFERAWFFLKNAEKASALYPKTLKDFRHSLMQIYPEPDVPSARVNS